VIKANIARESALMTDEAHQYRQIGKEFAGHDTVIHGRDEYVRYEGDRVITDQHRRGLLQHLQRGMKGVYQHCGERHLHRYLAEFDHRYSYRIKLGHDDQARTDKALAGIKGKRLMYRRDYEEASF